MLNFIVGYFILINIISMIFMYADMKNVINLEDNVKKCIYVILGTIGGSIGILVTSQMFGYKRDEKIIKKIIPSIVFVEVLIIGYFFIRKYELF